MPERCPKCCREFGYQVQKTRHHLKPKRFFGYTRETIPLCRDCHNELEKRIPLKQQLPIQFYYIVVNVFLGYKLLRVPER